VSETFWNRIRAFRPNNVVTVLGLLALLGLAPLRIDWQITLTLGFAWATAAVALDLWQGYLGELSFGHGFFVATGAYTWTILRVNADAGLLLATVGVLLVAAAAAVISGVVIVQLNHFGAAIVTFFMAFVMSAFLNSSLARHLTGGQGGLPVPPLEVAGLDLSAGRGLYYLALTVLGLAIVLTSHYAHSSTGRALEMIRQSPKVASLLGVPVKPARLSAFVFSGSVAALGGVIVAQVLMYVTPDSFTPWQSVMLVAMVVIGGQRTIIGPVLGAIAYQSLGTTFQSQPDLQALYSALIFLAFVILAPGGIISVASRAGKWLRLSPSPAAPAGLPGTLPGVRPPDAQRRPRPSLTGSTDCVPALVVANAHVEFNGVRALNGAHLITCQGEVHALIGPNGAGKTTLINVVSGIQQTRAGAVTLFGQSIGTLTARRRREAGVSRTFQNPALVDTLTVLDNVRLGLFSEERRLLSLELLTGTTSSTQDREATTRCQAALALVGIPEDMWSMPAGSISYAARKLADLARSIVQSPKVLLLDEPTAGLSENEIALVERAIHNVRDQHGTTVVVVAHHVPFVRRLADRVTVLDAGSVLDSGDPATVTQSPQVLEAFIGSPGDDSATRGSTEVLARSGFSADDHHDGLRVRALSVRYGDAVVVQGLDLDVRPGEVVALTGANGAGKSTTLKALSGLLGYVAESITLGGASLPTAPHQVARRGLIHVPEGRGVIGSLTVHENLRLGALAVGRSVHAIDEVLDHFPKLSRLLTARAGLLSGGEQQMVAIARGLLGSPTVLMVDELSLGLSPKAAQEALATVVNIARRGPGVLLVDQNIGALASVCDRIYILKEGRSHLMESRAELATITEHYF
jgi:branched-chain amino acid transport system ATP-binding protein